MPHEQSPDETLNPDEAHAWSMLERTLRRDLPVRRIERRARLRTDRPLWGAAFTVVAGAALAAGSTYCPDFLVTLGMTVTGAGIGVFFVRTMLALLETGDRRYPAAGRRRH